MTISRRKILAGGAAGAWAAPTVARTVVAGAQEVSAPPTTDPPPTRRRFSASEEFSAVSNPNGPWSYRSVGASGDELLIDGPSSPFSTAGYPTWERQFGSGYPSVAFNDTGSSTGPSNVADWDPGSLALHPDNFDNDAVVRFTMPAPGGTFLIEASFTSIDTAGGDGENVALVTPAAVRTANIPASGGPAVTFSPVETLSPGDIVEVHVGKGPGTFNFDSTQVSLTLTEQ